MENKIRRLAKRDIVVKYLLFVAGIQISAAVELFVNAYFANVALPRFLLILVAGLALGVSSFISLIFAGEVEPIVKAGESVLGTTLEKDRDQEMNRKLDETVSMIFLSQRKRIDRIKAFFWSDIFLSTLGLGITILGKP
jgi:hypothetical protein